MLLDAPLEATRLTRMSIRQAGVMSENAIADDFSHGSMRWRRGVLEIPGAGRRVIDADVRAMQALLKARIIFSQVMQEPRRTGQPLQSERPRILRRTKGNAHKMFAQQLPVCRPSRTTRVCEGVCHVFQQSASALHMRPACRHCRWDGPASFATSARAFHLHVLEMERAIPGDDHMPARPHPCTRPVVTACRTRR